MTEVAENFANGFFHVIGKRRSIRKYTKEKISDEHIRIILDAARVAPSTNNSQPWRFIVVKDQDTKELLTLAASNQRFIANASAIVVILGDRSASCCPSNPSQWHIQDTMIAAEHIVLAATALGYGSCWVAMLDARRKDDLEVLKTALHIPDGMEVVALVTLGVPNENPSARPRKELHEIAFSESFGNPLQ